MGATRSQGEKYGYVWELEDVRRREKDEPWVLSLHSFAQHHSAADKSGLAELEKHGRESLSPGEGTPHTSHPAVHPLPHPTSPFLLLRPHPNPSFSCLLPGWTGEGTRLQQWLRQRDREPAKQKNPKQNKKVSPEAAAAAHGFLSQVLDMMCACRQARDKGARYGGCAPVEEEVFLTCQKCLRNCSVKQPTSAFPDERPIRLHSWKYLALVIATH